MVSNACGTSSAVVNLSITPSPTLQVNSSSICSGGIATLVASGAITYTWSTGSNASTFTVNPGITSFYTVTGTSSSCVSAPLATSVTVISSINLNSTSATVCSGSGATLYVSGASSYTWSNASIGYSVIVSPLLNTTYSVIGSAPGCLNASTTANVFVHALPTISFALPFSEVCETEPVFQINASPSGGSFSGPGMNGNQFSPTIAGLGTHTITYLYTDANFCINTASQTLTVMACTGLQNEHFLSGCLMYPNPVQESLTIDPGPVNEVCSVRVLTFSGQEIKCLEIKGKTSIMVQELPPGLYLLEINTATKRMSLKFIKE